MLQIICVIAIILSMIRVVAWGQKTLSAKHFNQILPVTFMVYTVGNLYCTLFSRVPGSGLTVE